MMRWPETFAPKLRRRTRCDTVVFLLSCGSGTTSLLNCRSMLCRDANQEVNQPNSVRFPYTTGRTESNLTAESVKKTQSFAAGRSGRCSCLERKPADLTAWVYSVKKSTRKKSQAKILRQDVQQNIRYASMVHNHTTTQINLSSQDLDVSELRNHGCLILVLMSGHLCLPLLLTP